MTQQTKEVDVNCMNEGGTEEFNETPSNQAEVSVLLESQLRSSNCYTVNPLNTVTRYSDGTQRAQRTTMS